MSAWEADDEPSEAPPPGRSMVLRLADKATVGLFFAPVILSALFLGAVRDWAWAPMAVVIGLVSILVASGLGAGRGFDVDPRERRPLLLLIGYFVFFIAFALFQMASFAPASGSDWLYAAALRILGQAHPAVPDLAIDVSRNNLLRCVTCALVFLMARTLCKDVGRARLLLWLMVACAAVVMGYALLMQAETSSCYVGTYLKKQGSFDQVSHCLMSGTFVNSNSFASYLGMAILAALALIFSVRRRESRRGYGRRGGETAASLLTGVKVVLVAFVFLFLGGLLLSGSRAGVAATLVCALGLALLMMRGRWRERPDLVRWFWVGMALLLVIGVIAGGTLLRKFQISGDGSDRVIIWLASLKAISLSPWLGWGLGSFGDIYAIVQPASITQPNNLAHSTPIETVVELGVIGAIPAFAVLLLPWAVCLRGALRRNYRRQVLSAAAFAIAAVPILHSMVDFSLQIPAIGYLVSAVLGMGWAQAFSSDRRRSESAQASGQ